MEIFIEGTTKESQDIPIASRILLFVHKIIQSEIRIHMVGKFPQSNVTSTKSLHLVSNTPQANVPVAVMSCKWPALMSIDGSFVQSGLCCVLRTVVKQKQREYPESDVIKLLGYSENCVKACAEVSPWTRFCETDLPVAIETALDLTDDAEIGNIRIPDDLFKLENCFNEPAIIRNINKRKQQIKKLKSKSSQNKMTPPKILNDIDHIAHSVKDLNLDEVDRGIAEMVDPQKMGVQKVDTSFKVENVPSLEHLYVQGADLTMADYMLFICVHMYLEKHYKQWQTFQSVLPNTLLWYQRMVTMGTTQEAANMMGLQLIQGTQSSEASTPKVLFQAPENAQDLRIRDLKGKSKSKLAANVEPVLQKLQVCGISPVYEEHPEPKIRVDWDNLPREAHPKQGDLPPKRWKRKCEQLENLVHAVTSIAKPGQTIVDFCSGGGHLGIVLAYYLPECKGHLGIVLAYYLPECKVILVENKEESLQKGMARVQQLQLNNVLVYQCNLDYFSGRFDIGVCLHACGGATDMLLQQCLTNMASFVLCPCCYGSIQPVPPIVYPQSLVFKQAGLLTEDMMKLAHAADQTELNIALADQGNLCMALVDTDRCHLARERGYSVSLCKLEPETCTPKNNMLIGTPLMKGL
ncbi:unnamed protein product [Owenia fusiformis]|uniref:Methyltransferase domain-containing protein n=1 Tax=Owenia fusiformis TaxID=6347 RepID=A0A8S4NA54_OWEFU|nr:unnamed protein product [Owenia fusiformis]